MYIQIMQPLLTKLGFWNIALELSGSSHLMDEGGEGHDFVRYRKVTLYGLTAPDERSESEDDVRTELGYIEGYWYLAGSAEIAGTNIVEEADGMSQDLLNIAEVIYVDDIYDDEMRPNVLYVEHLFLKPEFRGTGLARHALFRFIELHDPAQLRAIVTCPSAGHLIKRDDKDGEKKSDDPLAQTNEAEGNVKLELFLERLGFRHLSEGFYSMFFDNKWRERKLKRKPRELPKNRVRHHRILGVLRDRDRRRRGEKVTVEGLAKALSEPLATVKADLGVLAARGKVKWPSKGSLVYLMGETTDEEMVAMRVGMNRVATLAPTLPSPKSP